MNGPTRLLLPIMIMALVLGFPPARAVADCVDYSNYFHWAGSTATPNASNRLAAAGNLVFICSGGPGLMIYDVSNPSAAQLLATLNTPGGCTDVVVAGSYVLVADGASGLQTVDVSDPSHPVIVHTLTPGTFSYLDVEETRLAAIGGGQFRILDVSDPLAPLTIGAVMVSANYDVELRGNYAYVGGQGAMRIIDVSNPSAPVTVGTYSVTGYVTGLDVMGHYVGLGNSGAGFETSYNFLVDVSNPAMPTTVWTEYTYVAAYDVVFNGTVGFLFGSSTLEAWDFSNPANPTLLMSDYGVYSGHLALAGGNLYDTDYYNLTIYDVTPLEIAPLTYTYPNLYSYPNLMRVAGTRVYTAGRDFGDPWIDIIDASNPAAPVWLNAHEIGHYLADPTGMDAVGNYLMVAISRHSNASVARSGLAVVNVSNPASPSTVVLRETTKGSGGLAIVGNYVYMGQLDSTLAIFNIQTPTNPVFVTAFHIPGVPLGLTLSGNLLHVAAGEAGGMIVDFANPLSPVLLSTYDTPGEAYSVTVRGSLAFVADNWGGFRVMNVANPAAPDSIAGLPLVPAESIALEGDFAYVALGDGVAVVNISTPASPRVVGAQTNPYYYDAVSLVGDYIYSGGTDGSLNVLALQCEAATGVPSPEVGEIPTLAISSPWPNPSTDRVYLRADMPAAGHYAAHVFDAAGRLVKELPEIVAVRAGSVLIAWDGSDGRGVPSPAGVYFLKLANGSDSVTRKIIRRR